MARLISSYRLTTTVMPNTALEPTPITLGGFRCGCSTGCRCASLRVFNRLLASVSSLVFRLVCLPVALSWM